MHKLALEAVYKYLLIGGMPNAVQTFLDTGSYLEARGVLTDLYDNYLADMEPYQASPEAILRPRKIFRGIYIQLNKESRDFKPGLVKAGTRTRDMKTPIDWLTMAYIVHQSFKDHVFFRAHMESNKQNDDQHLHCNTAQNEKRKKGAVSGTQPETHHYGGSASVLLNAEPDNRTKRIVQSPTAAFGIKQEFARFVQFIAKIFPPGDIHVHHIILP